MAALGGGTVEVPLRPNATYHHSQLAQAFLGNVPRDDHDLLGVVHRLERAGLRGQRALRTCERDGALDERAVETIPANCLRPNDDQELGSRLEHAFPSRLDEPARRRGRHHRSLCTSIEGRDPE